jgi:polar amino acid transport system substrate-binding protein
MRISTRKSIDHIFPRRRLLTAVLAAALGFGAAMTAGGPAIAQDTLAKIKKSGEMVVGTSAAYAPFEFRKAGNLVGFDIDLGEEIAKRMGVKVKWVEIDFKGIIAGLKSKRADVLITAMTKTPGRAEQVAFSIPYYDAGIGAAKPKGSTISKPQDLAGKTVGVQIGTSGQRYVKGDLKNVPVKEIKTYDTILLALKDLENGRVDAVVNPLPSIAYNLKGLKGLEVTDVWTNRVVGINTRKEDTALMAEINKHIADLKKEGFLDKLNSKWF